MELLADLLERSITPVVQPEPKLEHPALTPGQQLEDGRDLLSEELVAGRLGWGEGGGVLDEVAKGSVFVLLADRRIEGDRLLAGPRDLADLVRGDHDLLAPRHGLGDLHEARLATELREKRARDADQAVVIRPYGPGS